MHSCSDTDIDPIGSCLAFVYRGMDTSGKVLRAQWRRKSGSRQS